MRPRRISPVIAVIVTALAVPVGGCSSTVSGSGSGAPGSPSTPTSAPATSAPPAPSSPAPTKGDAPLSAPDGDFAISLPGGWIDSPTRARDAGAYVVYLEAAKQDFSANVNVVREDVPAGTRIESIQPLLLEQLRTLHISRLSPVGHRTLGGHDAIRYDFERVAEGGVRLRQLQVAAVHDTHEYVVTYTDTVAEYAHDYADALSLIDSWHWG